MKICTKCKQEKDESCFQKGKQYKDGLYPLCRDCRNAYYRDLYHKDVEKGREKGRLKKKNRMLTKKEHMYEVDRLWREKNPDKTKVHHQSAYMKSIEQPDYQQKHREKNLRLSYGITQNDYEKMLADQDGKCAICKSPEHLSRKAVKYWPVDHDHETGKVRGLLCHNCNSGLGQFKDSIPFLQAAIDYLERNKTTV